MPLASEPIPYTAPLLEGDDRLISRPWYAWLYGRGEQLAQTPQGVGAVALPATTTGAISPTAIVVTQGAGLYRVSWYLRITTAAGVSSSATVTIGWTETAITLQTSGAAVTGNTITTTQSETRLLQVDGAVPITYAVAYASNPAGVMKYRLNMLVEQVG